jgi:hypothetical protein
MRLLGVLLCATSCAWAEISTEPDIALALPLETLEDGIHFNCPVLINPDTIIPPSEILRCVYAPVKSREEAYSVTSKYKSIEDSRTREDPLKNRKIVTEEERANLKISKDTVWKSPTPFQLALQNLVSSEIRLVTMDPKTAELEEFIITLSDGLFLGEKKGQVVILAVEKSSPATRSGLKAGDIITRLGEHKLDGGLKQWIELYRPEKLAAENTPEHAVRIGARQPSETAEREALLKLPPSLKGGYLDQPH